MDDRPIIQWDDFVWYVASFGARHEGKTYCHLVAVHQKHKDGSAVQIADWVDQRVLRRAGIHA